MTLLGYLSPVQSCLLLINQNCYEQKVLQHICISASGNPRWQQWWIMRVAMGFSSSVLLHLLGLNSGLPSLFMTFSIFLFFLFLSNPHLEMCLLLLEREEERERHQLVASHMCPDQGLNPPPRYVPQNPTEPATFWDDAVTS